MRFWDEMRTWQKVGVVVGAIIIEIAVYMLGALGGIRAVRQQLAEPCPPLSKPQSTPDEFTAEKDSSYQNPKVLTHPMSYPVAARDAGVRATATLQILIRPDGHVHDAMVLVSSGFCPIDAAAIRQVASWTFEPAKVGGKSIEVWYVQRMGYGFSKINPQTLLQPGDNKKPWLH